MGINKHISNHKDKDDANEHAQNWSADVPGEQIIVIQSHESVCIRYYVEIDRGSLIRAHEKIVSVWKNGKKQRL